MKLLSAMAFLVTIGSGVFAQSESPIPRISQQITDYFSFYPNEKIFITTDKQCYKPGELIWFNALVTDLNAHIPTKESQEIIVKLYNKEGAQIVGNKFKLENGSTPGDLEIPDSLRHDKYYLVAYTSTQVSPDEVFCTTIEVDPAYSNQLVANTITRDSISVAGQKNELYVTLKTLSGEVGKNTTLRFQITNGKEIIEKGKLKTDNAGKAILPFTLPDRSNGEPFICELTDNKAAWKKEVFLPSNIDPLVIKFYPEGGTIVEGVPTKIGFTAFNKWGIPVAVQGSLMNQEGKQVAAVHTFTKGLGLFATENDGRQKLKLVLSGKTGQKQSFDLPTPKEAGLSFSVTKTDNDFISANLVFGDKQKHNITLVATSGSILNWAADMETNGTGRIKIPVENLPQGINLISVFSKNKKLQAERLVFVNKKQQLKVEVQPEKRSLKPGDNMKIKIRLTDENNQPVSGFVNISIADSFRKTDSTRLIDEYLLDDKELETPFSLISSAFQEQIINPALMDIFLIANRTKGFNWQKILTFNPENAKERNMGNNGISGIVSDKNGNKISKAKVSLVNNKNLQLHTTTTNQDGMFSFPNLNPANKDDFSAKATDPEGKRDLNIVLSSNFEGVIVQIIGSLSLKNRLQNENPITNATYIRNNPDLFTKAAKISKPNTIENDNQRKLLSTSTSLMDVIKAMKSYSIVSNQIVFTGSENSINFQGGALIVIDGQQVGTEISAVQNISPSDVDHINISTNPMDIQRYTGFNSVGIIEIFLKKAEFLTTPEVKESSNRYDGEFRVPNVFQSGITNPKSDFRTTLLWAPELKVDQNGYAEISVTAGKVLSDFIIEVHGRTEKGMMGSGKERFSVNK